MEIQFSEVSKLRFLRILSLLFIVTSIISFSNTLFAADKPSINLQEPSHDFGTVKRGDVLIHDFVFTNDGNDVLQIKDFILS